jgi:hypothetical protein
VFNVTCFYSAWPFHLLSTDINIFKLNNYFLWSRYILKFGHDCPHITSWSLRGVNVLSAMREGVKSMLVGGRLPIGQRQGDVVIHSLTANIGQFKHCNGLVHFFLWGANVFTLDSNEHFFRSRNLALPQDSHSLRGSTRDPWTVDSDELRIIFVAALRFYDYVSHLSIRSETNIVWTYIASLPECLVSSL